MFVLFVLLLITFVGLLYVVFNDCADCGVAGVLMLVWCEFGWFVLCVFALLLLLYFWVFVEFCLLD